MSSMYFDLNRSLAWGLGGQISPWGIPLNWETALFNGLVTGGAETGSTGALDNNFAYSARIFAFPTGEWGAGTLADFDWHETLATRIGAGYAGSAIDRNGPTEFNMIRVVDSGDRLGDLLPVFIDAYNVNTFCVDASCKYRGWSVTSEYYLRNISGFQGGDIPDLFDHGFWLEVGKFVVPRQTGAVVAVVARRGRLRNARTGRPECGRDRRWIRLVLSGSKRQVDGGRDLLERGSDQLLGFGHVPWGCGLAAPHTNPVRVLRRLANPAEHVAQHAPARWLDFGVLAEDPVVVQRAEFGRPRFQLDPLTHEVREGVVVLGHRVRQGKRVLCGAAGRPA